MSVVKYVNPQTNDVWFDANDDVILLSVDSEDLINFLTKLWKTPPGYYSVEFTTGRIDGAMFSVSGAKIPIVDQYMGTRITQSWKEASVYTKQQFMGTMALINEYVVKNFSVGILRKVSETMVEIEPAHQNSGMWEYICENLPIHREIIKMEKEAKQPYVANRVLHVPTNLDARSAPFHLDQNQMAIINIMIPIEYNWCLKNDGKRETLRRLASDENFVAGLPPNEKVPLRALLAAMQD